MLSTVYSQCTGYCRCYWYSRFSVQETSGATGKVYNQCTGDCRYYGYCLQPATGDCRFNRYSLQPVFRRLQVLLVQAVQCTGDCNCYRYSRFSVQETQLRKIQSVQCTGDTTDTGTVGSVYRRLQLLQVQYRSLQVLHIYEYLILFKNKVAVEDVNCELAVRGLRKQAESFQQRDLCWFYRNITKTNNFSI